MKSKKIMIALCVSACSLAMTCCGNNNAQSKTTEAVTQVAKELDPKSLVTELQDAGVFQDEIAAASENVCEMLMGISAEAYDEALVYMGSGATSERLAIFTVKDDTKAEALVELGKAHIEAQKEAYAGYMPEEVDVLEHAVVERMGQYVILGVAKDYEKMNKVLDTYR